MREIKFRAWDKKRNVMIGSDYPKNWCNNKDEWYEDEDKMYLLMIEEISVNKDFQLMQYTGMKDKNGKAIYEGDIVKAVKSGRFSGIRDTYEVKWEEEYAGFYPFVCCDYGATSYYQHPLVIIGNIHETPELLQTITSY